MKYFIIKNKDMPWGDYGDTLFKGFLNVMDKNYNDLEIPTIERTGPYIPEIYIANSTDLVITEKVKKILEDEKISGIIEYKKIKIKKIVNIDWQKWDINKEVEFYPKSGEPEDYILKGKNDDSLVDKFPNLSNVKTLKKGKLYKVNDKPDYINYLHLEIREKIDEDIFSIENMWFLIVSEKFKNILEMNNINDLKFIELKYNSTT